MDNIKNDHGAAMEKFNIEDIDVSQNVSDFAHIIEDGYEEKIDRIIDVIESRTTAEIAVVTLEKLDGISIDDAARKLFNKFGLGKASENNGVLLLICPKEGKFRFELGFGLEDIINEDMRKTLVDKVMVPGFKNDSFGPTILGFLKKVSARITRSRMSSLSVASWYTGISSLVLTAAGVLSAIAIALTSFPDLEEPAALIMLFVKTCIPAVLSGLAAAVMAIIDFNTDTDIIMEERIVSRSIAGLVMGTLSLILVFVVFFFFTQVADFAAMVMSVATAVF